MNASKTTYVIFRPVNNLLHNKLSVKFEDTLINQVQEQKSLWVQFKEDLSWSVHIKSLSMELARTVGCLYRMSQLILLRLKKNIYFFLFYSKLTYGLLVWGTTTQHNCNKLITLQKTVLRHFESFHGNVQDLRTAPLFKKHSILRADQLYYLKVLQEIHQKKLYESCDSKSAQYLLRHQKHRTSKI